MNIEELSKQFSISNTAKDIVKDTIDISGKDFDFRIADALISDALTKTARESMPKHIVYLKNAGIEGISHIISHECGHIQRIMKGEREDRIIPRSTSNRAVTLKVKEELRSQSRQISDEVFTRMFKFWVNGTLLQAYNTGIDARIELWLYNKYPELREEQFAYYKKLLKKAEDSASDRIKRITPAKIFENSAALNYALFKIITPITGKLYKNKFKGMHGITALGEKLYKNFEPEDKGLKQDNETMDKWCSILGMENWYEWGDFEEIPPNYENNI